MTDIALESTTDDASPIYDTNLSNNNIDSFDSTCFQKVILQTSLIPPSKIKNPTPLLHTFNDTQQAILEDGGEITHVFSERVEEIKNNLTKWNSVLHQNNDSDFEVKILNNSNVNAWCSAKGNIAIFSGLLDHIAHYCRHTKETFDINGYTHPETGIFISYEGVTIDDLIAAVIAHEMAHAQYHHSLQEVSNTHAFSYLLSNLDIQITSYLKQWRENLEKNQSIEQSLETLETFYDVFADKLGHCLTSLFTLSLSRSFELEADAMGTKLLIKSGYNPVATLCLLEILKKANSVPCIFNPKIITQIQNIFKTHPLHDQRQHAVYPIIREWQVLTDKYSGFWMRVSSYIERLFSMSTI